MFQCLLSEEDGAYIDAFFRKQFLNSTSEQHLNIDDVKVCETLTEEDILDNVRIHKPANKDYDNGNGRKKTILVTLPVQVKHIPLYRFLVRIN